MSVQTFQSDNQKWLASIQATDAALQHIRKQLDKSKNTALRLSLQESGCTGYKYVLEEVKQPEEGDLCRQFDQDVNLYVAPEHLVALKDLVIDFEKVGLNQNLVMNNPNVKDECGCGESFNF